MENIYIVQHHFVWAVVAWCHQLSNLSREFAHCGAGSTKRHTLKFFFFFTIIILSFPSVSSFGSFLFFLLTCISTVSLLSFCQFPCLAVFVPGCKHVKGIMLFGPPGCGKTLMARQIGKMLNAREPKVVNGPEILNKYVGESEANIRKLFAEAEEEQKRVGHLSAMCVQQVKYQE